MGSGYVHQSARAERTTLGSDIPYVLPLSQRLTRNTGRVKHFNRKPGSFTEPLCLSQSSRPSLLVLQEIKVA